MQKQSRMAGTLAARARPLPSRPRRLIPSINFRASRKHNNPLVAFMSECYHAAIMKGCGMKMFRCFCIATMACGLAAADIVTHTANDIGTFSSFTDGSHWSDLLVPHSGADYVTTGGSDYTLRTPASGDSITYTFG